MLILRDGMIRLLLNTFSFCLPFVFCELDPIEKVCISQLFHPIGGNLTIVTVWMQLFNWISFDKITKNSKHVGQFQENLESPDGLFTMVSRDNYDSFAKFTAKSKQSFLSCSRWDGSTHHIHGWIMRHFYCKNK